MSGPMLFFIVNVNWNYFIVLSTLNSIIYHAIKNPIMSRKDLSAYHEK